MGGERSQSNMRDNVHLIDEQDIQLMKVNGMPERIGEGAYGIVYRGEWTFDKESADVVDPWLERRSNRVVTVAVNRVRQSSERPRRRAHLGAGTETAHGRGMRPHYLAFVVTGCVVGVRSPPPAPQSGPLPMTATIVVEAASDGLK